MKSPYNHSWNHPTVTQPSVAATAFGVNINSKQACRRQGSRGAAPGLGIAPKSGPRHQQSALHHVGFNSSFNDLCPEIGSEENLDLGECLIPKTQPV
jgi:hypothetical protein